MTLIRLACPNCDYNLAEENLHSNILLCPRCNSYIYYESGMYNKNVFFGLLKSHNYKLNNLKMAIIDRLVKQGSLKAIRKIKFLQAERVLVPVREINDKGKLKIVPLLELSQDAKSENADIRQLFQGRGDIGTLFNLQHLQPLRLSAVKDQVDLNGNITRTTILPVGRTKRSVDTAYKLMPEDMLRILYVPVYRLTFNNKGSNELCFANDGLSGLSFNFGAYEFNGIDTAEDIPKFAAYIGAILAVITAIPIIASENFDIKGHDILMTSFVWIVGVAIMFIILFALLTITAGIILFILSKLFESLNVITAIKRYIIRHTLYRKFKPNKRKR